MQSCYLDDLNEGDVFESSGRTISESDLSLFSMISGDWHPIHADAEFAKTSRFGQRILHGPFGVALALGLFARFGEFSASAIAATGIDEWSFREPIFVGDTLKLHMTIGKIRRTSRGDSGIVERCMRLMNQHGRAAQEGRMGLIIAARGKTAPEA